MTDHTGHDGETPLLGLRSTAADYLDANVDAWHAALR
jgi:hypothetical protein